MKKKTKPPLRCFVSLHIMANRQVVGWPRFAWFLEESELTERVQSTPVDVTLLAKHRGKNFNVRLRAIKDGAGLVKSEQPLEVGSRLILHSSNPLAKRSVVQLFVSVVKHYEKQRAFALRWDKLVSPSGTGALTEFLQETLGISVPPGSAMATAVADGEMVYYEFASEELHLPNQGRVASRNGIPKDPADFPGVADFGTSPLPSNGAPNLTTEPLRSRSAGGDGGALPTPEAQATTAAVEADKSAKPFYQEDEEVVELFGMKVTKENWDRLENLEYKGTHHSDNGASRPVSRAPGPAQHKRETPRPAATPLPAAGDEGGDNAVSRFFRKIADKLADKE